MQQFVDYKKERIETALTKHRLRALIASLPANIDYLSGYESIGLQLLNRNRIFSVYSAEKDAAVLVIPTAEIPTAIERFPDTEMQAFGEFFFVFPSTGAEKISEVINNRGKGNLEALIKTLSDLGIESGRVGLDEGRITPQMWHELAKAFPGIQWVPAADIFYEIRMIKHKHEITLLEESAKIAEESMYAVLPEIETGTTEFEIGQRFMEEVAARGAKPYFNVVTVDERSAFSDTINTAKQVQEGSIIRLDFGCIYKGYCSDLARTAVFGKCDAKVSDYYQAILAGEERAVEKIRPGISTEEIYYTALNETRKAGIPHYNRHHCGHGIGLEIYDWPSVGPGEKSPLEAGMVLCIETPYYELGWGGLQVEDTVLVTEEGVRFLSKSSRELVRLGV